MRRPYSHLIWVSPMVGLVLSYGAYLAYASGYRGVVVPIRSGQLKTLGRTYTAQETPAAFWLGIAWNAFITTGAGIAAAMTVWWFIRGEMVLSVLGFFLFVSVLSLSELLYRLVFRALRTGVMAGRRGIYRRDRQPGRYWASILGCLLCFVFPVTLTWLVQVTF